MVQIPSPQSKNTVYMQEIVYIRCFLCIFTHGNDLQHGAKFNKNSTRPQKMRKLQQTFPSRFLHLQCFTQNVHVLFVRFGDHMGVNIHCGADLCVTETFGNTHTIRAVET